MHYRHAIACITLLSLSMVPCAAGDKLVSDKEIIALVEQLASPNKEPPASGGEIEFPAGYDEAAQQRVLLARTQLKSLGLRAVPFLLKKVSDKRYSFTQDDGPADGNWHVGETCLTLVRCQLQPYGVSLFGDRSLGQADDPRQRPIRPSYFEHYKLDDPQAAKKWWAARKDKSLRELQIETLDWVIGEESKQPEKYSQLERTDLCDKLAKLRSGKTPLEPAPWPVSL